MKIAIVIRIAQFSTCQLKWKIMDVDWSQNTPNYLILYGIQVDAEVFFLLLIFMAKMPVENRKFLFTKKQKNEIKYSICVVLKGKEGHQGYEYCLTYTIGNRGVTKEKMERRGLQLDDKAELLYKRNGLIYNDGVDSGINEYLKLMKDREEKRLWFSQIAPSQDGLNHLYEWFRYVRDGLTFNETNHQDEKFMDIAKRIANKKDEDFRNKLLRILQGLDNSIMDIQGRQADIQGNQYHLWVFHKKEGDARSIFAHWIKDESAGTRKLIEQFPLIDRSLEHGMPFICDEFDRMLHPVAFKQLVEMFNSKQINPRDAQLIFTAHDTIVLDSDYLRRDEVQIIEKIESFQRGNIRLIPKLVFHGLMWMLCA